MPLTNIILNGDFQSNTANWSGNDLEITPEHNYFSGGDNTDRVAELDGAAGTTVLQQQFTISSPITTNLEFEFDLRQRAEPVEGLDGFRVEVLSVSDGSVVYTSGDLFPTDNNGVSTTTQDFSAPVTFTAAGDYILRFTEITLTGGSDGRGVIIDDVSLLVCFLKGTLVETKAGPIAIENLSKGDLLATEHNGFQAIRWIGSIKVKTREKFYPVRIVAGALGNRLPRRDLLVSRQHRLVVSSRIAQRMFGCPDVLVSAIRLTDLPGVYEDNSLETAEYFHILFDQHEIIFAEGTPVESLYTGKQALQAVSQSARAEIISLFPELEDVDYAPKPALPIPDLSGQKSLIRRHFKQNLSVSRRDRKPSIPP